MCGIAGRIEFDQGTIKREQLESLSGKIAHRGPDDQGLFISHNKRIGLVSRRLAIIDLSKAGHQPMSFLDKYWITFNGEIYNYQEKRRELVAQGYKFRSHSDTEVILALYHKYGTNCLDHLRGMFAFALYDSVRDVVFIARDRLGKKPLKYFYNSKVFIFSSELKAILTQQEVKATPDFEAIRQYLSLGYCPTPRTGFNNIYKLKPAHYMIVNLKDKKITQKKYWHLDFSHKLKISESKWQEKILSEVETATKLRMISDVPIGAFLSGGVDSSAIVAFMAKNSRNPINTFTIGFESNKYDESEYANRIAKMYKTNHTKLVVNPQSIELLPELARMYEEPFADSSSVVTYLVSKLARQHVTVILNGDGGDENFAGYDRHIRLKRDYWLQRNPWALNILTPFKNLWPKAGKIINKQSIDLRLRFLDYKTIFNPDHDVKKLWLSLCEESQTDDFRDQLLYSDLASYFTDDLLTKVDIASMAVGLEARSPLSDHKIVELAAQIPYELKVKGKETKYIFKKSLEGLVPNENLYRKKMGFSIPLAEWFSKDLKPYTSSVLLSKNSLVKDLFKPAQLKDMIELHSVNNDFGPKLWSLLSLELWWREYFSN